MPRCLPSESGYQKVAAPAWKEAVSSSCLYGSRLSIFNEPQIALQDIPGLISSNSDIFPSSRDGLGPNGDGFCRPLPGCGVPERELLVDAGVLPVCVGCRGPGGADIGRVLMCNGGNGFPLACGNTSSRLTGIPSAMRCWRRIRERVQFGGFVGGGDWNSKLYSSRL